MARMLSEAGRRTVVVKPVPEAARQASSTTDMVFAGRLERLSLPAASVPTIGLFDVLEHLDDPVSVLAECRRVVSADGMVIVTVPAHRYLWSRTDDAAGHERRYTKRSLASEAHAAGLHCKKLEYFSSLPELGAIPTGLMRDLRVGARSTTVTLRRESQMLGPSRVTNAGLRMAMSFECALLRHGNAPFGLSLLALLRPNAQGKRPRSPLVIR